VQPDGRHRRERKEGRAGSKAKFVQQPAPADSGVQVDETAVAPRSIVLPMRAMVRRDTKPSPFCRGGNQSSTWKRLCGGAYEEFRQARAVVEEPAAVRSMPENPSSYCAPRRCGKFATS
jgi:hypothetical protein